MIATTNRLVNKTSVSPDLKNDRKNSKHGSCNTVLKPVNTPVVVEYPHEVVRVKSDKVYYFIDWLTFYGKDLNLSERHEKLLVDLMVEGRLFMTNDQSSRELISYEKRTVYGQIHQGSEFTWNYCYVNSVGVKLFICRHPEEPERIYALKLQFTGRPLSHLVPRNNQLKLLEVMDLMRSLDEGIAPSRIDTTMEFSPDLLNFDLVVENAKARNFSGFKRRHIHISDGLEEGEDSITVLLGSEKSKTKKVRIYNTKVKHGYDAIRIELENKRDRAKYVNEELLKLYDLYCAKELTADEVATRINDFIRDYNLSIKTFNFVEKESKKAWKKASQYKELCWWTKFKEDIEHCEIEYRFINKKRDIQKSIKWLMKSTSNLLCALKDNIGLGGLFHFLKNAIAVKENGFNCKPYNPSQSEVNLQLLDLGQDAMIKMFDDETRWQLRQVGYFNSPLPMVRKDRHCFLRDESLRERPRTYQECLEF